MASACSNAFKEIAISKARSATSGDLVRCNVKIYVNSAEAASPFCKASSEFNKVKTCEVRFCIPNRRIRSCSRSSGEKRSARLFFLIILADSKTAFESPGAAKVCAANNIITAAAANRIRDGENNITILFENLPAFSDGLSTCKTDAKLYLSFRHNCNTRTLFC